MPTKKTKKKKQINLSEFYSILNSKKYIGEKREKIILELSQRLRKSKKTIERKLKKLQELGLIKFEPRDDRLIITNREQIFLEKLNHQIGEWEGSIKKTFKNLKDIELIDTILNTYMKVPLEIFIEEVNGILNSHPGYYTQRDIEFVKERLLKKREILKELLYKQFENLVDALLLNQDALKKAHKLATGSWKSSPAYDIMEKKANQIVSAIRAFYLENKISKDELVKTLRKTLVEPRITVSRITWNRTVKQQCQNFNLNDFLIITDETLNEIKENYYHLRLLNGSLKPSDQSECVDMKKLFLAMLVIKDEKMIYRDTLHNTISKMDEIEVNPQVEAKLGKLKSKVLRIMERLWKIKVENIRSLLKDDEGSVSWGGKPVFTTDYFVKFVRRMVGSRNPLACNLKVAVLEKREMSEIITKLFELRNDESLGETLKIKVVSPEGITGDSLRNLINELEEIHEKLKKKLYEEDSGDKKEETVGDREQETTIIIVKNSDEINVNRLAKIQEKIERISNTLNEITRKEKASIVAEELSKTEKKPNENMKVIMIYLYNHPDNLARTTSLNAFSYIIV